MKQACIDSCAVINVQKKILQSVKDNDFLMHSRAVSHFTLKRGADVPIKRNAREVNKFVDKSCVKLSKKYCFIAEINFGVTSVTECGD